MSSTQKKLVHAATLADVGREAGVSAMAASTVLNGARTSSRIAAETRQRILEAAKKLNYRPNGAARALADRRMNTIGVAVVQQYEELNQYFLEVFNGVLAGAAKNNQNTTVFALKNWNEDAERIPSFCDGRIDGLLLIAPSMPESAAKYIPEHTPFVSIHGNASFSNVVNLESDEETGAFEMVKHIASLGYKRIMHLTGPHAMIGANRRVDGYRRALEFSKIKFEPGLLLEAGYETHDGSSVMNRWLDNHKGALLPEVIFCANDALAIGVIEALESRGYTIPNDISVVGFDDTLLARYSTPPLTTVRQPLRVMGTHAVEVLVARIECKLRDDVYRAPKSIVFPTELVLRTSLGQPRKHRVVAR